MRPTADADWYRARQLAEIAPIRGRLYAVASNPESELAEVLLATDRLLKIQERESKLLNLDKAPTPLEEAMRELQNATDEEIAAELAAREDS